MRKAEDVLQLLDQLQEHIADELEAQDLDFKEWGVRSLNDNLALVTRMAVCMANGGGGTVVFGIADRKVGRDQAILGVPLEVDLQLLIKRVYETTDPHLTPVFEEIIVPEGTGRLLIMQVYAGMPPYTETSGAASIRQGKECLPYTGTMRRQMIESLSQADVTAETVAGNWRELVSPSALEKTREMMAAERAPELLTQMNDEDLLTSIGGLQNGNLTHGALLLFGRADAITRHIPEHRWSYRKMQSDTDYTLRDDGCQSIITSLYELERYVATDNPVVTIESGLVHPEFSTYPKIALREALLNAFGHRDYRMSGTVMLKHFRDKLILTNPGQFMGGISAENILHHPPVARNHHLMDMLDRLRLVNRSNLGVSRIFKALLMEGKEPPIYREVGQHIELTFLASPLHPGFLRLVQELTLEGKALDVDHLLVVQYLIRHEKIDTLQAMIVTQRSQEQARELLGQLLNRMDLLESVGRGKGRYFTLSKRAYETLKGSMTYERQKSLDKEAIKIRILSLLKDRSLTNKEIRQMTGLDTRQVHRLIKELETDGVSILGRGVTAKYVLTSV